jgi:hypothetical protein
VPSFVLTYCIDFKNDLNSPEDAQKPVHLNVFISSLCDINKAAPYLGLRYKFCKAWVGFKKQQNIPFLSGEFFFSFHKYKKWQMWWWTNFAVSIRT